MGDSVEQKLHRSRPELADGHVDGRQRRIHVARKRDVVSFLLSPENLEFTLEIVHKPGSNILHYDSWELLFAEAKTQAHALLVEARTTAEKERALAMEKTLQGQQQLLERARRDIAAERDRAIAELRQEAVELSLAAASKLIGERLNSETDRKLVQEYLTSLDLRN